MNDIQKMMYDKLVTMLNNDVMLYWTRTQIFIFIEAVALPFVATQLKDLASALIGCVVGFLIAVLWLLVLLRINKWLRHWHKKLAEFETTEPAQLIKIFADEEFSRTINEKLEIANLMTVLVSIFMFAWVSLAIRSAVTL